MNFWFACFPEQAGASYAQPHPLWMLRVPWLTTDGKSCSTEVEPQFVCLFVCLLACWFVIYLFVCVFGFVCFGLLAPDSIQCSCRPSDNQPVALLFSSFEFLCLLAWRSTEDEGWSYEVHWRMILPKLVQVTWMKSLASLIGLDYIWIKPH